MRLPAIFLAIVTVSAFTACGGSSSSPVGSVSETVTSPPEPTCDPVCASYRALVAEQGRAAASARAAATPAPSPSPTPTAESLTTSQQIANSYRANLDFMARASADNLRVQTLAGLVEIDVHPQTVLTEGDALTIAAESALVASRAIWTTYPDVQQIELKMLGDFTDQFGASTTDVAASITVLRATAERFQYDGLRDLVYGDNKHLFCVADHYQIHLAIYQALGDTGCLSTWGFEK